MTLQNNVERIRLDCVRNEPQSEPFVGQARLLLIENIFLGCVAGSGRWEVEDFLLPKNRSLK